MILLLDNFDSFTYNLADYIGRLGRKCHVIRNNIPAGDINIEKYSSLVISPGPEVPATSGNLMEVLSLAIGKIPILGICLGHQALAVHFGGEISKADKPMHGKLCRIFPDTRDVLFKDLPGEFSVVRYNSLLVSRVPANLKVTALSETGEVMALSCNEMGAHGVQFHPEAILTEHGRQVLGNWLDYYSIDS